MKAYGLLGALLLTIAWAGLPAHAQSTAWTNTAGGNWSVPGNWSPNIPPGPGTNAFITNNTATAPTVINDVPGNTFADLTIFNAGAGYHTLFSSINGLYATGNAFIGRYGLLIISNATFAFGGSVTVSNQGFIYMGSNSFLNVGGADQASANASGMTLTNLAGGLIELGSSGGSAAGYIIGTINASTTSVGIVNQGTIRNYASAHYVGGIINASVFNDTNGVIITSTLVNHMTLNSVTTNRGRITVANVSASLSITNGSVVNEGVIYNTAGGFSILNGALINSSNALATIAGVGGSWLRALSTLNYGTLVVSNLTGSGGSMDLGGPVTNYGTMVLYRAWTGGNMIFTLTASNIVNYGIIRAVGAYGTSLTNLIAGNTCPAPVTNQPGGTIVSTNGSVFVLTSLQNNGTLVVHSNSVFAVGYTYALPGKIDVGSQSFTNDGNITLQGGNFAVALLTNSVGGTVQGQGDIGRVALSNLVSASLLSTNFVRFFSTKGVINAGLIAPNGVFNAGAVTNLSGGKIAGFGNLRSLDTTNFYAGETLVISNVNTGARIGNAAGADIRADGGTLTIENGFAGDTQFGTIGATNGGVLRVGDGSQSLTNNGAIELSNGQLVCGALTVTNGSVSIDLDHLAATTNGLVQAGNLTLGPSSTLALTGAGQTKVLIRYTGSRAGVFGAQTGVPRGYRIYYGPDADGSIKLAPFSGTIIKIR